uniref:RH22958p n=1 Tax=Drosophila melanogaster TaxID=7227 RepID=Q8SY89_DROME|nr:RH22958p [Drosophila melanogaster]
MGASNRILQVALCASVFSLICFVIAFSTPYWLVTDGRLQNQRFTNLGLWEVCFNNFQDIHRFFDNSFNGCLWVFEEEYYIIHDFLLPGFYISVQLFATLCFVMCLVVIPLTVAFLRTSRDDDRYMVLLLAIGSCQVVGSVFGFIAVVIFGAKGDSRDWMPGWQNNDMGWSFALGVVGAVLLLPSGVLYLVGARRERYKRLNEISNREISEYGDEYYQNQGPSAVLPTAPSPYQSYFASEPSRPRRPQQSSASNSAVQGGIQTDI